VFSKWTIEKKGDKDGVFNCEMKKYLALGGD
jgi:hypothetical protein